MPGILPMKVIKVGGTSAQSRIAQACDRCRSKKIRCDGIRPCCSQCANVGFECKTSDKLSRRAFPRGYTESLEERVRSLEAEVREMKELLDEKDEKLDMLTKLHPQNNSPSHSSSPRRSSGTPVSSVDDLPDSATPKEETFKVQQSPCLFDNGTSDSYFAGTSSGKKFIDSFKLKVQERGRSSADISAEQLLSTARKSSKDAITPSQTESQPPPRLLSDQLVNVFFQEWAPLFPVLHRPTFLALYEEYTASPESMTDSVKLAQLNLVFALAATSQGSHYSVELGSIENQWRNALNAVLCDQSMQTLQCLVLAQLRCLQRGDYERLMTYKALAVSLSSRLGLHQSQKRFPLGALTCETRKKVFWTLYTLDSFSAVLLGLPRQIKDDDVSCEYPVDADDEYVTERGFQPLLPGESTRLSSALALFRASRVLSKVLEEIYPASPSYELSLPKLSALADELETWSASLAPHLRLPFAQDKPSVGTVSSRAPFLSLTYHFIRTLIHRPAVCASMGDRSASSLMAMAGSSKSIVQILQLLSERGLSFSFCLNKEELLVLSGFGLLYQGLDLDNSSKVLQDNQKMLAVTIAQLDKIKAASASNFRRAVCSFLPVPTQRPTMKSATPLSRHNSDGSMPAPTTSAIPSALKQQFKAMTSKFTSPSARSPGVTSNPSSNHRRATEPNITPYSQSIPTQSLPNLSPHSQYVAPSSEPSRSPQNNSRQMTSPQPVSGPTNSHSNSNSDRRSLASHLTNLDYLSFSAESTPPPYLMHSQNPRIKAEPSEWERILGSLDNGQTNIFDNIYGGPAIEMLKDTPPAHGHGHGHRQSLHSPQDNNGVHYHPLHHHNTHSTIDLSHDDQDAGLLWAAGSDIWNLTPADMVPAAPLSAPGVTESVASFSTDEGLAPPSTTVSLEDMDAYRGIVIPSEFGGDEGGLLGMGNGQGWESAFVV